MRLYPESEGGEEGKKQIDYHRNRHRMRGTAGQHVTQEGRYKLNYLQLLPSSSS